MVGLLTLQATNCCNCLRQNLARGRRCLPLTHPGQESEVVETQCDGWARLPATAVGDPQLSSVASRRPSESGHSPCCRVHGTLPWRTISAQFSRLGSLMRCQKCQHDNEEGANFCEECAAPLARACAKCGHRLSPTAKFCPEYAHPTGVLPEALPAARFTAPSRREDPHLKERPRRRAQAGHSAIRRPQRFDGAARIPCCWAEASLRPRPLFRYGWYSLVKFEHDGRECAPA